MKENEKSMEKRENAVNDELLKEVLGEYAERGSEAFGQEQGENAARPGERMTGRMKRTFWYYGGGRKKMIAIAGACAASAVALLLAVGIWNIRSGRGGDQKSGMDITMTNPEESCKDNTQYEVYMNYYGEGTTISYANAQSQSGTSYILPEEISSLPKKAWSELSIYTDAETAIRNSNYKNFGYLCADGRGKIYYSDMAEHAIYMSNEDGSGLVKLTDGAGNYLQERDGKLYYTALDEGGAIMCLDIATREKKLIMDEPHGEFLLTEEGLLVNAQDGVLLLSYEQGEVNRITAMSDKDWQPALFTASEESVLFNAVQGADVNYYIQGYLLFYDRAEEEVFYMGQVMLRPLLAGNYLLAVKGESMKEASLHVMDMAAGTDTDLGVWPYDDFVSDGTAVYYTRGVMLCKFVNGESREIMNLHELEGRTSTDGTSRYLYLAGDYLYWMTEVRGAYEWHSVNISL